MPMRYGAAPALLMPLTLIFQAADYCLRRHAITLPPPFFAIIFA
jgi:hypothetical protein